MAPPPDDEARANGRPDYGRILGRIEQKVDELQRGARTRDQKLDDLTERVRQAGHKSAGDAQLSLLEATKARDRFDRLEHLAKATEGNIDGLGKRVAALEAPVRRAMAARQQRRAFWLRVVSVSASIGLLAWGLAEPIYRQLMPMAVQTWLAPAIGLAPKPAASVPAGHISGQP